MKLICETIEEVSVLKESREDGKKDVYIQGPFLMGEDKNRNGRVYPIQVLAKEVARYTEQYIDKSRAFGELGHPDGPSINLDRISHIITSLKQEGTNFIGKAKLTNTPMGNIARGLLESGANLGVSSRALGSLQPDNKTGAMMVQSDLRLATAADIVADPSAPDAFVKGIMENVEWIYDSIKDTWREEKLDNIKKQIHTMSKREIEEQRLAIFENYVSSLAFKINK
jgi:hypothetical protein